MSQFPTQRHLASWAGMCPGKEESAGKRRSGKTREGSKRLRSALTESARAAARSKGTYLAAHYARLRGRRGSKKAAVAVGRSILVICYHAPERQVPYEELGEDYFDRRRSGEAHANHDGAVELVSERRPDVVLLDLEMPGAGGGDEAMRRMLSLPSLPKVVVYTMHDEPGMVGRFLRRGRARRPRRGCAGAKRTCV